MAVEALGRLAGEAFSIAGDLSGANFIRKAVTGEEMNPAIARHHFENIQNSFEDGRFDTVVDNGKSVIDNGKELITSVPDGKDAVIENGSDLFDSIGHFFGSILDCV